MNKKGGLNALYILYTQQQKQKQKTRQKCCGWGSWVQYFVHLRHLMWCPSLEQLKLGCHPVESQNYGLNSKRLLLVVFHHPFEKYESNWIISPRFAVKIWNKWKQHLKKQLARCCKLKCVSDHSMLLSMAFWTPLQISKWRGSQNSGNYPMGQVAIKRIQFLSEGPKINLLCHEVWETPLKASCWDISCFHTVCFEELFRSLTMFRSWNTLISIRYPPFWISTNTW